MATLACSNGIGSDTTPESGKAWYCLMSQRKHEHIVAAHLESSEGVEAFCPRIRFRRRTRKGLVWVMDAMFPGYVFARFNLGLSHRKVRYAPGVRFIVQFGGKYPTIGDATLSQLRAYTGRTGIKVMAQEVSRGDGVTVLEGAFVGLEAVVTEVLPAVKRVKILMDFLGRGVETEVKVSSVLQRVVSSL